MEPLHARPGMVTTIGWLYMVVGLLMLLTGAAAVALIVVVDSAAREGVPEAMEGAPAMFYVAMVFVRYFGALGFFQIIVALAVMVAAGQFMKGRAWARLALEVFSWLSLLFVAVVGALWVYSWVQMTAAMPQAMTGPFSPVAFTYIGAALWVGLALMLIAALSVLIKLLRSDPIRKAVS